VPIEVFWIKTNFAPTGYKGVDLYPLYALELKGGARPLPIMEKLLKLLAEKDDWRKAFWFASINSISRTKCQKISSTRNLSRFHFLADADRIGFRG
jgi:hypothetical protein